MTNAPILPPELRKPLIIPADTVARHISQEEYQRLYDASAEQSKKTIEQFERSIRRSPIRLFNMGETGGGAERTG